MAGTTSNFPNTEQHQIDFQAEEIVIEEQLRKCHRVKFGRGIFRIELNPVVTVLSLAIIAGLVGWCSHKPQDAFEELWPIMNNITDTFSWLYVGARSIWALLIIAIYFSKYSKLKLGKDDEAPEYTDFQYFTMLFSAGIGMGLFYSGVAEPIFHYTPGTYGNRFAGRYSDNQRAQDAINVTFLHWGIHAWISFAIVGLLLSLVSHRWRLPMSIRSCFYPILGQRIYGLIGDLIDTTALICSMFAMCSSLGIGAMQLNDNLYRINRDIPIGIRTQIGIIIFITLLATASAVSGLKLGVKILSEICFVIGTFLMLIWLFYGDTWFFLNSFVQSIGYYFQNIVGISFHTEAFAQLGIAMDQKESPGWFRDWTMFYWGWWIAWTPFVGMFIAKISRGRTIKQFIMHTMAIPIVYIFLWFSIFGSAGIEMERKAEMANIECNSTRGGSIATEPLEGLYRLSCRASADIWFDLMAYFTSLYPFLAVVSLIAIMLNVVTTSDSCTLVVDSLAANGHPYPPIPQRIVWGLAEGGCAILLLYYGGYSGLSSIRVVCLILALSYNIQLNFMCIAIWRVLQIEAGELDPNGPQFSDDILAPLYVFWPIVIHCQYIYISQLAKRWSNVVIASVAPWYFYGKIYAKLNSHGRMVQIVTMLGFASVFCSSAILVVLGSVYPGLAYIGAALFIGFAAAASSIRNQFREVYRINGNVVEDFFVVLFLFPFAAVQMDKHIDFIEVAVNDNVPMSTVNANIGTAAAEGMINSGFHSLDNTDPPPPHFDNHNSHL